MANFSLPTPMTILPTNVRVHDNASDIGLPKWPGLIVQGTKVTEAQAAEILIRTDASVPSFDYACNDRDHCARLGALFGYNHAKRKGAKERDWDAEYQTTEALKGQLKMLSLSYVGNRQIVSSWIGGPYGWCHWSGDVRANTFNIGKWPSVKAVCNDWALIAAAFPYLELTAWLHNGETCEPESRPIVRFEIKDGAVDVYPQGEYHGPSLTFEDIPLSCFALGGEIGISIDDLQQKLVQVYGAPWPTLDQSSI